LRLRTIGIESITQMSKGREAVFSGGKRELEKEEERPAPVILGRKAWVYGPNPSHGRGGGRGGAVGRGFPRGGHGGSRAGLHAGGYGFSPAARGSRGSGSYGGYNNSYGNFSGYNTNKR
jgi:hypothetical protein